MPISYSMHPSFLFLYIHSYFMCPLFSCVSCCFISRLSFSASFPLLRCFCVDCLDLLVGAGASNSARDLDPWLCYMCQPLQQYGVLKRRHDWSLKLQEFFVNDNGQEFVSSGLLHNDKKNIYISSYVNHNI